MIFVGDRFSMKQKESSTKKRYMTKKQNRYKVPTRDDKPVLVVGG